MTKEQMMYIEWIEKLVDSGDLSPESIARALRLTAKETKYKDLRGETHTEYAAVLFDGRLSLERFGTEGAALAHSLTALLGVFASKC